MNTNQNHASEFIPLNSHGQIRDRSERNILYSNISSGMQEELIEDLETIYGGTPPIEIIFYKICEESMSNQRQMLLATAMGMESNNKKLRHINEVMKLLYSLKSQQNDSTKGDEECNIPQDLKDNIKSLGISVHDKSTWNNLDSYVQAVKTKSDEYSNVSQEMNMRLQQETSQYTTMSETASSIMKKIFENKSYVNRNVQ